MTLANSLRQGPDASGHFGEFGGRYVAETLMPLILELEEAYRSATVHVFPSECEGSAKATYEAALQIGRS